MPSALASRRAGVASASSFSRSCPSDSFFIDGESRNRHRRSRSACEKSCVRRRCSRSIDQESGDTKHLLRDSNGVLVAWFVDFRCVGVDRVDFPAFLRPWFDSLA
jgi:hypothetical protein